MTGTSAMTILIQDRRFITVPNSHTFQNNTYTKINVMDRIILFPGSVSSSRYCEVLDLENQIINIMYIYNRLDIMLKELELGLPGIQCNSYFAIKNLIIFFREQSGYSRYF